jgi:hypothetical protein
MEATRKHTALTNALEKPRKDQSPESAQYAVGLLEFAQARNKLIAPVDVLQKPGKRNPE